MQKPLVLLLTPLLSFIISCGSSEPTPVDKPLISASGIAVQEGESEKDIFINLTLSKAATDTVVLFASTADQTAVADEDYLPLDTELILFFPGDTRSELRVTVLGDDDFEPNETFKVEFFSPVGADLDSTSITIVLQNDDRDTTLVIPTTGYTTPTTYEGMTLVWQDEFSGSELGEDWTYEFGGGGWGNNELQYYRDKNTLMREGNLVIEARKENFGGRAYTSSRLITKDKYEFLYGRVDVRAVLPFGQGLWPAIWMLGANIDEVGWPRCGEIDIMEMIGGSGREKTVHGTVHWQGASAKADFGGSTSLSSGTFADEFHVFSIIWTPNQIRWLMDDKQYHVIDITPADLSEFRLPQFFIMNIAVGGNWPGSPNENTSFPQRMVVDYIRVFQEN